MEYSKEQKDIINFVECGEGNLIVNAGAGSGKTTIMTRAIALMKGDVLGMAYTAKNAAQLRYKLEQLGLVHAKGSTFHSECFSQYKMSYPKVKLDKKKVSNIAFKYCDTETLSNCVYWVADLVSKAKQYGIGIEHAGLPSIDDTQAWLDIINHHDITLPSMEVDEYELIEIAKQVLKESNRDKNNIDFDDMIYLVALLKISHKKYNHIVVDEAQDTNVVRKIVIPLLSYGENDKQKTRVYIIGDYQQAIMGFTGAQNDSMAILRDMFNCTELPLYTCFRCGKNIIKSAQEYNPNIRAFENNHDGTVSSMKYSDFTSNLDKLNLNGDVGIICRNNAPIIALAFTIIRQGIGCRIEGRDIGQSLKSLTYKWKKVKDLPQFIEKLTEYFNREFEKAKSKMKYQMLEDKLETMIILIERCLELGKNDLKSLQNLIDSMFSDSDDGKPNIVTLSSIHKAKGLEFETCYILGESQLQPSRYARLEWEQQQERNLIYVARTRAIQNMIFIEDIPLRSRTEED